MGFSLFRGQRDNHTRLPDSCHLYSPLRKPEFAQIVGVIPVPLGVLSPTLIFAKMCIYRTISVYLPLHQS